MNRRHRKRRMILLLILVGVVVFVLKSNQSPAAKLYKNQPTGLALFNKQLAGLPAYRVKIVKLAESQLGYRTNPVNSYCNKYSAYWVSGASDCPAGEMDEEWCADFAAWTWAESGVTVNYQYIHGDINSSSASFYEWGVRNGTWHPVGSKYIPLPGDVAVYGLDIATLYASHVAVVIGTSGSNYAPAAINGDADHKSFSDVEFASNEIHPDSGSPGVTLAGYVSPRP